LLGNFLNITQNVIFWSFLAFKDRDIHIKNMHMFILKNNLPQISQMLIK